MTRVQGYSHRVPTRTNSINPHGPCRWDVEYSLNTGNSPKSWVTGRGRCAKCSYSDRRLSLRSLLRDQRWARRFAGQISNWSSVLDQISVNNCLFSVQESGHVDSRKTDEKNRQKPACEENNFKKRHDGYLRLCINTRRIVSIAVSASNLKTEYLFDGEFLTFVKK